MEREFRKEVVVEKQCRVCEGMKKETFSKTKGEM